MTPLNFGQVLIEDLGRCRTHIGECLFYYKNIYNGETSIEKALLPRKQSFTGWLSPEGFLFACPYDSVQPTTYPRNYEEAAKEILLAVGCEAEEQNKNAPRLQSKGWVLVVDSDLHLSQWRTLTDHQEEVLRALKGATL